MDDIDKRLEKAREDRKRILREIHNLMIDLSQHHELPKSLWDKIRELEGENNGDA